MTDDKTRLRDRALEDAARVCEKMGPNEFEWCAEMIRDMKSTAGFDLENETTDARHMLARLLAAGFDQAEFSLAATKDATQSPALAWRFRGCVYGLNEWIAYDYVGDEPDMGKIEEEVTGRLRAVLDAAKEGKT